jgi:hypothetical protein
VIMRASTTISVLRSEDFLGGDVVDRLAESYGDESGGLSAAATPARVIARGVRANIGSPGGSESTTGGNQENVSYRMQADPVDLLPTDQVRDDRSGLLYDVVTAVQRSAFGGREYTQVTLTRTRGAA